jgi:exonuclease V gamma subunit
MFRINYHILLLAREKTKDIPSIAATKGTYYNIVDTSKKIPLKDLDDFMASHNKTFFQEQFAVSFPLSLCVIVTCILNVT